MPEVVRVALVSGIVAAAMFPEPMVIVGASFVPVMVMITLRVPLVGAPLESVARTTYVRTSCSPAAR